MAYYSSNIVIFHFSKIVVYAHIYIYIHTHTHTPHVSTHKLRVRQRIPLPLHHPYTSYNIVQYDIIIWISRRRKSLRLISFTASDQVFAQQTCAAAPATTLFGVCECSIIRCVEWRRRRCSGGAGAACTLSSGVVLKTSPTAPLVYGVYTYYIIRARCVYYIIILLYIRNNNIMPSFRVPSECVTIIFTSEFSWWMRWYNYIIRGGSGGHAKVLAVTDDDGGGCGRGGERDSRRTVTFRDIRQILRHGNTGYYNIILYLHMYTGCLYYISQKSLLLYLSRIV